MTSKDHPIPDADLKRAWRVVTIAGTLGSIYGIICFGGALRVKYLSELNATASDFGLMSGLGMFVIAFQIVSGFISNRLPRRRTYWLAIALTHRAIFTVVLMAPLLFASDRARIWWIIFILFFHDTLAQMSVPPWSAWMADLLPRDSMNRYWAGRQRFIMVAQIVILLAAALIFRWFEVRHQVILGYTVMSIIGIVAGLTDLLLFLKVPEPPIEHAMQDHWLETILQPLRDREFRPFIIYLGYWHFAVFIAAPFFGVCMIEQYKMSAMTVMLLWLASIFGTAVTSRFWGLLCDTYGYRPVLRIISAGVIILPAFFLLTPPARVVAFPAIAILFFIDGVVNSGMMLAVQGIQLKMTPRRNRTMYIASANFLSIGLPAGLASILSGYLIDYLNPRFSLQSGPWHFTGYHCIFALSALMRLGALRFA
ncbi:MAG: MFS transporter, partial [Candidatus Sumerlaeota bacterium]|nr:MFS transporter [Candidatus Sumerlaeota bacterium]